MRYAWPDIANTGTVEHVNTGTVMYRQDERVTKVFVVLSGLVYVQSRVQGQDVLLGLRGRGWTLGCGAATLGIRHRVTATVLRDCVIRKIPVEEFHRLRRGSDECNLWLQNMQAR